MSEKTTIYDIAKKLNISAATVSRALNNNPKISESTCKLVQETATKMNYKQNRLALALKSGKSGNIGVIVPRINTNFFGTIIRGIEEELHPNKYNVIICQTHEDENREIENINTLLDAQVDGIMISITNESKKNEKIIHSVLQKNVPLIFFDRKKNIDGVSSVTIDDFKGGYMATKHLIDEGCKRIAHLCGDQSLEIYENRFKGYRQALLDNNIEFDESYVIRSKSSLEDGAIATTKLLALSPAPDAIFSASDFAALGAIQELKANGIKIPQDFCVVGFGNEPFTKFMELSISTVDQSPLEMGNMVAKVFLEQINHTENFKMEKKIVLNPILHVRKSSSRKEA
ncbi:LacI family DNA-binding transcriptional regulator [uncultured Flavobacterium sp.]|uniref:LacI family DNA-binding transcriptional regulator n=1 Tax=uncultured Flavobacterium sp. TaxID=165435 RepID=UPI0030EC9FFD|tara:strand:- start:6043 stop:7071 length:1029 start_codon:yes stop_codon:yes gene_type:complete